MTLKKERFAVGAGEYEARAGDFAAGKAADGPLLWVLHCLENKNQEPAMYHGTRIDSITLVWIICDTF